jgi:colanic acid/amylovoran biosynthesis glycosyltransferase
VQLIKKKEAVKSWRVIMLLSKKTILALVIFCFHTVITLESRPLKVLFVVAYFPAPSQTFILNQIIGLIDKGHEVTIFALRKNDAELDVNVAHYSLMDLVIYETLPAELPECDIIFCQSGTIGIKVIEMGSIADWVKEKKLVVCLRGMDVTSNAVRQNPKIYEKLFKQADLFLPVCDYFRKLLIQFGCDPDKIVVHHSAINCSQFFFRERKRETKQEIINLVSVCRLVQKKGLDFAIKAVARLSQKYKNIHYTIVGKGHLQPSLQKLVQSLGIRDKVTFFGWGTRDQVVSVLDASHIFLLPSVTSPKGDEEGIANALKEAMAMGLISIGSVHAGTPELIEDGVCGFLVPEKTSKLLARKIKYAIKHPELWKSIGLAARKKIEDEFETKKSIEELENMFYKLLE